jgi:para-nitrobenzyl esterase
VKLSSIPFGFRATIPCSFIFAFALLPAALASSSDPVITTTSGLLQGTVGTTTIEYLGIPYAAAPAGSLRWMPPQPYGTWTGILQATKAGSECPQVSPFNSSLVVGEEDCLFLNVYTPLGKTTTKPHNRAVMVWIHGGGLNKGAGSDFNPTPLVEGGDVIVVTFNYRLGLLGFFAEQQLDAEGHLAANYGLMDQQFALQWVKNNIAAFGGDPTRITVFGESAGGLSVYSQLASPTAAGLFDRAISQSGAYAGFSPDYRPFILPIATAESTGYSPFVLSGAAYATAAGCPDGDTACLRAASYTTIVQALGNKTPYPVIDGTLLTQTPGDAFASGNFNQVPVITGNNHDEYRYFVGEIQPALQNSQYDGAFVNTFASFAPSVEAEYPFPPPTVVLPPANETEILLATAGTDGIFVCPARRAEMSLANYVTVWAYEFDDPDAPPPASPPYPTVDFQLLAYHSADVQYLFDKGTIEPGTPHADLSAAMISYWTEFAKKGNPNSTSQPHWAQYHPKTDERQLFSPPTPTVESGRAFEASHMCSAYWDTL